MKVIVGFGAILLCFTKVAGDEVFGGLTPVSNEDAKTDKNLQTGLRRIKEVLAAVVNIYGFKTVVNLPDMKLYRQLVSGTLYHYYWTVEEYKAVCQSEAESDKLCENKPEVPDRRVVKCKATYWVKAWVKDFGKLTGPECEEV